MKLKYKKRFYTRTLIYCMSVALLLGHQGSSLVSAYDRQMYEGNDVLFYDPTDNSCYTSANTSVGPEPSKLTGKDNYEKVWNYFTSRGLSPVLTAGVMGNLEKESHGMNPWGLEGASYHGGQGFGIVQWTGGRRPPVEAALKAAGITEYNDANREKGLLVQLNYLWKEVEEKYGGWDELKKEKSVGEMSYLEGFRTTAPTRQFTNADEMKGKGSLLYFHAVFVRSGDEVVPEPGHGSILDRMKYGLDFFEKFGSGTGGACSQIGEGGLTFEQAKKLMDWYLDGGWQSVPPGDVGSPMYYAGTPGMGQCFAWSNFVAAYILKGSANGKPFSSSADGIAQVKIEGSDKDASHKWAEVTKKTIQPFTVIAYQGHTGIIVGIHDGKIIYTEINVSYPTVNNDTTYVRPNIVGSSSKGRVTIVDNIDDIQTNYTQTYKPLASPRDMNASIEYMQNFLDSKGI